MGVADLRLPPLMLQDGMTIQVVMVDNGENPLLMQTTKEDLVEAKLDGKGTGQTRPPVLASVTLTLAVTSGKCSSV